MQPIQKRKLSLLQWVGLLASGLVMLLVPCCTGGLVLSAFGVGDTKASPSPAATASPSPVASSPGPSPTPSLKPSPTPTPSHPAPGHAPPTKAAPLTSGVVSCADGYYGNVNGSCVHRPTLAPVAPVGATAECVDGTYSFSQHRQGTCSHHGGVKLWL